MFFGVPRVWEKMAETLKGRMSEASGLQKTLLDWSIKVNRDWHAAKLDGRSPGAGTALQRGLANALVTRKIKAAMAAPTASSPPRRTSRPPLPGVRRPRSRSSGNQPDGGGGRVKKSKFVKERKTEKCFNEH